MIPVSLAASVKMQMPIWQLLQNVQGWTCIESSQAVAPALGRRIEQHLHVPVRYLNDLHHTLTQPAPDLPHPSVRLLTMDDLPLIEAAQPYAPREQTLWMLNEGAMAGAIVDGQLVAWAQTYADLDAALRCGRVHA